jgi:putrescine aminotransferase
MAERSTAAWQQADVDNFLHPFTDYKSLAAEKAMIITRGKGCYVWDSEGNQYLDGLAGLACVNIGYGREEIAEAAAEQMRTLSYFNNFFKSSNQQAITLSETLVDLTPAGLNRVFYVNSGSEANDTCIRMVRHYWALEGKPDKQVIISRDDAYHGSTIAAASLGGMPSMHAQAARLPDFDHVGAPYQFGYDREMPAEEFGKLAASWLDKKITEIGADRVAAFFGEPVQGAGGAKIPPANYWGEIQAICKKHDVLLVADEVICGFGRTGNWFGADTFGIENLDLMCLAKGITSAYYPLSAVMVGDRIAESLIEKGGEFHHGFTYSGHPVACAVANTNIGLMHDEGIIERARDDIGPYFGTALQQLSAHPLVGEVRSCGMIGAFELVKDAATCAPLQPAGEAGERFRSLGLANGIITRPVGETVTMMPPLVISHEQVDFLVEKSLLALNSLQEELEQLEQKRPTNLIGAQA